MRTIAAAAAAAAAAATGPAPPPPARCDRHAGCVAAKRPVAPAAGTCADGGGGHGSGDAGGRAVHLGRPGTPASPAPAHAPAVHPRCVDRGRDQQRSLRAVRPPLQRTAVNPARDRDAKHMPPASAAVNRAATAAAGNRQPAGQQTRLRTARRPRAADAAGSSHRCARRRGPSGRPCRPLRVAAAPTSASGRRLPSRPRHGRGAHVCDTVWTAKGPSEPWGTARGFSGLAATSARYWAKLRAHPPPPPPRPQGTREKGHHPHSTAAHGSIEMGRA